MVAAPRGRAPGSSKLLALASALLTKTGNALSSGVAVGVSKHWTDSGGAARDHFSLIAAPSVEDDVKDVRSAQVIINKLAARLHQSTWHGVTHRTGRHEDTMHRKHAKSWEEAVAEAVVDGDNASGMNASGNETNGSLEIGEVVEEKVHDAATDILIPCASIFLLCVLVAGLLESYPLTRLIPESAVTVLLAALCGIVLRSFSNVQWWLHQDNFTLSCATLLNLGLLPVIMFNTGWQLDRPHFLWQFEYVLIYAILGTLLTTLIISLASWQLGAWGLHIVVGLRPNLAFAALISSTDPVATVQAYNKLRIPKRQPLLNTFVVGEASINDAVAITLFAMINNADVVSAGGTMVTMLLFSILLGIGCAAFLVLLMRMSRMAGQTETQVLYVFISAYATYAVAYCLDLSGIIATLFAGILFRAYGTAHLSTKGEESASEFLHLTEHMADNIVFIICGLVAALLTTSGGFGFGFVGVCLCLISRAIVIPLMTGATNSFKALCETDPIYLTWKHQIMMWLGGLRGGISLVLALEIDEVWCSPEVKGAILEGVFIIIVSLLLLCGGTTEWFLSRLGFTEKSDEQIEEIEERVQPRRIAIFVNMILEPILIGDPETAHNDATRRSERFPSGWSLADDHSPQRSRARTGSL